MELGCRDTIRINRFKDVYGFRHQGLVDLPPWAGTLKGYYWIIRVEGRNIAKRRKFYRKVEKEKLKLAEEGIDQRLIINVCRYLRTLSKGDEERLVKLYDNPTLQLSFDFRSL